MKTTIREKRRVAFEKRRITPKTIRYLARIIDEELNSLTKEIAETAYIMFSIDANDDTSYESQSSDIFGKDKIIESKVIRKITMRFYTINNSKNIEIQIVHSLKNDKSENFILVSGDDKNWVSGVLANLSEALQSAEPQPKNSSRLGYFMFFSWVVFIIEYIRLITPHVDNFSNAFLILFVILGIPIASVIGWSVLNEYLNSLFPSIELQTGAEHQQIPAKKRKTAIFWVVVVIIPVALEGFMDIIKSLQ